jgi:hypothetical protein
MRQDNYPNPVSDPEAEGLPDSADDDSVADERANSARIADGPSPAALPADRPQAVDRYGTTAAEQRAGESLDYKLAREVSERPSYRPDEGNALSEELDEISADAADVPPVQPNAGSVVSMYDVPGELGDPGAPVGRLVEPDEGVREDDEKDMLAYDAGEAGGGPTAEEAAMHEVRER